MADQALLQTAIAELNTALGEITPYKLDVVNPKEIQPVVKNAHYMTKRVFDQLVDNIGRDRNLSSLPFCWREKDGHYVALSGNHRTSAAVEAGVPWILILYTDEELSEQEQIAVQLSHNALVGKDNVQTLKELWNRLGALKFKVYSGLDENLLETMPKMNVVQLSEARVKFEYLTLLFVQSEIEYIEEIVKHLENVGRKGARWLADGADFEQFFETLLDYKEAADILNTSTAIKMIIGIVNEWLDEHKEKVEAQDVIA